MILNIDTKYYDTKYYSGLLYRRKQNFSKESIFSLLPSSRGRPAQPSIFLSRHRTPGCLPQSSKGKSAAPGSGHIQVQHPPTRPIPFTHGFSAGKEASEGQAIGPDVLQPTGHSPNHT